jgi:hypothetical protein
MSKMPFLIHLVFHPRSADARAMAREIHQALNQDPAVPGLRIPTRFNQEPLEGEPVLPPTGGDWFDEAERVFIAVLADDYLNEEYEDDIPEGRKDWGEWVADLYEACEDDPNRRCVPFQLTEAAWPLDPRLNGVNFPQVFRQKDLASQLSWLMERLNIELIRFLRGVGASASDKDAKAPVQAFISHTKWDLDNGMDIIPRLEKYLSIAQPIDGWFDSGDIDGGSKFEKAIEEGVQGSILVTVLTDLYSTREWCRKEIILAKEKQRPIVVINALKDLEIRGFPYLGNVPTIRWKTPEQRTKSDDEALDTDNERGAILLLLKEAVRQLHSRLVLEAQKRPDDTVMINPPELFTVAGCDKKAFLYPDPPLGKVEQDALVSRAKVTIETPLQRFTMDRPLTRRKIAVSLSESGDEAHYGFDLLHLDREAIEISRYLLLAGATICYGGHLGDKGYTKALFELVRSHPVETMAPIERIHNYVGWPLPLSVAEKSEYKSDAKFKRIGRPDGLSEVDDPAFVEKVESFIPPSGALNRYAWACGMTEMREVQTRDVEARVVLGGKTGPTTTAQPDGGRQIKWYNGRIPGVLEEVLCSMKAEQPVYLVGGFGGCARLVADVLQGKSRKELTWDFQKNAPDASEMQKLYESRGPKWWSYQDMDDFIRDKGIAGLNNGLSPDENRELFETGNTETIVTLILKGLGTVLK